jgi:hypothetical protein
MTGLHIFIEVFDLFFSFGSFLFGAFMRARRYGVIVTYFLPHRKKHFSGNNRLKLERDLNCRRQMVTYFTDFPSDDTVLLSVGCFCPLGRLRFSY